MADLSDVETAIVTLISSLVYPNGTAQPSVVANDAGNPMPVRVFRGWPVSEALDADLIAGTANISVFPRGLGKNTTRYTPEYQAVSVPAATVQAVVSGNQVIITGAGSVGITQYVSITVGNRVGVSYAVQPADTAATIAAALAAAITAQFAPGATASGGVITVDSSAALSATVGVQVGEMAEIRRQTEQIQITLWCPTPLTRDNLAKAIEPTLASTFFLTLADSSAARFRFVNTVPSDMRETVQLYRRDLFYQAEYQTTVADTAWQVTLPQLGLDGAGGAAPPITTTYPQLPAAPAPAFHAEPSNG